MSKPDEEEFSGEDGEMDRRTEDAVGLDESNDEYATENRIDVRPAGVSDQRYRRQTESPVMRVQHGPFRVADVGHGPMITQSGRLVISPSTPSCCFFLKIGSCLICV